MFNPLGMAVGFLVARDREAKDPLLPALIGGMLPMPMGPVAAVVLADSSSASAAPAGPGPAPDPKAIDRAIQTALDRLNTKGRAGALEALADATRIARSVDRLPAADRAQLVAKLQRLMGEAASLWAQPAQQEAKTTGLKRRPSSEPEG